MLFTWCYRWHDFDTNLVFILIKQVTLESTLSTKEFYLLDLVCFFFFFLLTQKSKVTVEIKEASFSTFRKCPYNIWDILKGKVVLSNSFELNLMRSLKN